MMEWNSSVTIVKMFAGPAAVWQRFGRNRIGPGAGVGTQFTAKDARDAINAAFPP
jgi:hypothetical protein